MLPRFGAATVAASLILSIGCHRDVPLTAGGKLDDVTADFDVYWPPTAPEESLPETAKPLLKGTLVLEAKQHASGETLARLAITLTRPSLEADRESWNSTLAFADLPWMDQVRVWDAESRWQWPNLPYLLRLPGEERVERYGGMDPGKHVDNDFAAVLIRKYDASGEVESAETKDAPLVSAEWHAEAGADIDLHSVVHVARSDEFLLHLGGKKSPAHGQLKVWLIYADFLGARVPRSWPQEREWAGGVLAYFEVEWEVSPDDGCRGMVRQMIPTQGTRFHWSEWVRRVPGADESEAQVRLSDASH